MRRRAVYWLSSFLLLFFLGFNFKMGNAQSLFPADTSGKIVYWSTVKNEKHEKDIPWDQLMPVVEKHRVQTKQKQVLVIDSLHGTLNCLIGFYLYRESAFLKQVEGLVLADLKLKVGREAYISIISDIRLIDYTRDRYGKFSPGTSRKHPLEKLDLKRKSMKWKAYFITINEQILAIQDEIYLAFNTYVQGISDNESTSKSRMNDVY